MESNNSMVQKNKEQLSHRNYGFQTLLNWLEPSVVKVSSGGFFTNDKHHPLLTEIGNPRSSCMHAEWRMLFICREI